MEEPPESIKDLSGVLDILQPLESKWLDVGIHLKIKKDTILDSIEANHSKDVHRCLTEVIAHWQKNEDEPSWEKLANAVKKVGGYSDLLKLIPGHLPTMASTGVITREGSDSGFETSSSTPPSQPSSDSEQDVFDTSSLSPGCGCGECNIHKMCTEGCPKPDYANRLPILTKFNGGETASETASKVQSGSTSRQHSADSFEQETSDLCEHFGSLVTDVCKSLKTLADKDEVALYLLNSFPILKRKEAEINGARDMIKLFTVVTVQACSWFNFDIIKRLIKKFGSADDRKRLAKYQQHFERFAKQRLPQGMTHVEIGSKAGMTGCKKLVIKVDREWESISIGELERLRREFAKILKVDRKNLYLADVNEGCIMLTLMIPEEIANTLSLRKLTSAQKQMLASERVVRLSCGRLKWSRPSSTTQQNSSSDSEEDVLDEQPKEKCHRKAETRPVRNGSSSRMSYVKVLTSSCLLLFAIAVLLFLNTPSTSTSSFAWNATNRSTTCKFNANQIRPGMLNAAIQRDKFESLVRPGITVQPRLKNWDVNATPPVVRVSWELDLDKYQVHKEAIQKIGLQLNSDEQSLFNTSLEYGTDTYHFAETKATLKLNNSSWYMYSNNGIFLTVIAATSLIAVFIGFLLARKLRQSNYRKSKLKFSTLETDKIQDSCTADVSCQESTCTADVNRQEPTCTADVNRQEPTCTADVNYQESTCTADVNPQEPTCTADVNCLEPTWTADVNYQESTCTADVNCQESTCTADVNCQESTCTADVNCQESTCTAAVITETSVQCSCDSEQRMSISVDGSLHVGRKYNYHHKQDYQDLQKSYECSIIAQNCDTDDSSLHVGRKYNYH